MEAVIKKGQVSLVLLAKDSSERTREHFINLAKFKKIPWIEGGEKMQLGIALGKSARAVVAITGESFARKLYQLFGGEEEGFNPVGNSRKRR